MTMTRNQKLLIGLAGAGVLAYLLFKGSKAKAQTTPTGTTDVKIREKRANELSNEWCEIMSKAYSQGRELNQEEEMKANQIGKQVEQLGYTGLGFSIVSGVPNCNQLITIEESNKYPRF